MKEFKLTKIQTIKKVGDTLPYSITPNADHTTTIFYYKRYCTPFYYTQGAFS